MAPPGKGTRAPAASEPGPAPELIPVLFPITLGQFLKVARLASSGGEAKNLIALGVVRVNGEAEQRRGRKLARGDVVETGGLAAQVEAMPSDVSEGFRS